MTGWGQGGPLALAAGHDINYISLSGALAPMGEEGQPPPLPLNLVGDYGGGALYLVPGLLAGLLNARSSGKGQVVDAAMCDGAASLMTHFFALHAQKRWTTKREDNLLDGGAPFYRTYLCADGKSVAVGPIEPQFYSILRDQLGLNDALFDRQDDQSTWAAQRAQLARLFMTKTRDEWTQAFAGTDGCVTPVLDLEEAPHHAHFEARRPFVEFEGGVQPAPAPRFSMTPSRIQNTPAVKATDAQSVLARWTQSPSHPRKEQ